MIHTILYTVGSLLILWAAVVGVASVIVHARVDWRATAVGRHLMAYMSVIAAMLVLSMIRYFIGDTWWFQLIRLVVFTGVPVVMTQRLVLQLRAQRLARDERSQAEDSGGHPAQPR